jgi:hypothetical protein
MHLLQNARRKADEKEENFPVSGFLPHGVISHDSWPMFSS